MTQRRPVVILGGGMAAMAAAYELTRDGRASEYDVTVFQPGWMLGGKCASTRASHPAHAGSLRVQEHGLHVWFGFYFNAFSMMHECYGALADPHYGFDLLFERRSSTPMMEPDGPGGWKVWPLAFPEDPATVRPGEDPSLPSLQEILQRLLAFYGVRLDLLHDQLQGNLFFAVPGLSELLKLASGIAGALPVLPAGGPVASMLQAVDGFLAGATDAWLDLIDTMDSFAQLGFLQGDLLDELRRAWILGDLALATVRGITAEFLAIAARGFDALDDRDFRDWLAGHGASRRSLESAPVRALYDLCFAYTDGNPGSFATADFAAGTALRTILRIGMAYRGAVCYSMKAGMGEVVLAPLYRMLKARGVKFRFFHRADRIELDGTGLPVKLHFTRQAEVQGGGEYQPLQDPNALAWWPERPDFAQLANGAALQQAWTPEMDDETVAWPGEVKDSLDLRPGTGPVDVILAMSIGSLQRVTQDLAAVHPQWRDMLGAARTVATQAAQLWLTTDFAGLGYPEPARPAMIAAPEPQDVWADLSPVLASEQWPPGKRPGSVQYLCGPLAGHFVNDAQALAAVHANTLGWLQTMAGNVWPGALDGNAFDPAVLVGSAASAGKLPARLAEQHLRANHKGSERYVLSVAGSIGKRLRVDAFRAHRLFLAGDWTFNGLNAGCVEAAVISGRQAACALHGLPPARVPGSLDFP